MKRIIFILAASLALVFGPAISAQTSKGEAKSTGIKMKKLNLGEKTIQDLLNEPIKILDDVEYNPRMYSTPTAPTWTKQVIEDNGRKVTRTSLTAEFAWKQGLQNYNLIADYREFEDGRLLTRIVYVDVGGDGFRRSFHPYKIRGKNQDYIVNTYGFEGGKQKPKTLVQDLSEEVVAEADQKFKALIEIIRKDIIEFKNSAGGSLNQVAREYNRKAQEYNTTVGGK